MLSVLDRLIDEDPKHSAEAPMTRSQSLSALKTAIRRDLEWLLNTRQPVEPPPEDAAELQQSVYCYGLPDICSLNLITDRERSLLARMMESIISTFEPRLAGARITPVTTSGGNLPHIRFLIEAMLRIDPAPERISFDTVLDVSSGEYQV